MAGAIDDLHPPAIVEPPLMLEERDAAPVRGHTRVAQVAAHLVQSGAHGVLEAVATGAEVVDDRQRRPVRRPVRLTHVLEHRSRGAAECHARERAGVEALCEHARAQDDRELALGRHRQQLRVRHAKRLRRFRGRVDDEQIW